MTDLKRVKLYLNIPESDNKKDQLIELLIEDSKKEIAAYTNRDIEWLESNPIGSSVIVQAAVYKYNRRGTEGMTSQSFAGSGESYEGLIEALKPQLQSISVAKLI